MTPCQAHCLKLAIKLQNKNLMAELALLANIEYDNVTSLGNAFAMVADHMSASEWRSTLATLAKQGKYRAMNGEFNGQYGYILAGASTAEADESDDLYIEWEAEEADAWKLADDALINSRRK